MTMMNECVHRMYFPKINVLNYYYSIVKDE
jgi:hypothetical protein